MMGFSEEQIWFAIEIKGYDPESVQNFLLDNMWYLVLQYLIQNFILKIKERHRFLTKLF